MSFLDCQVLGFLPPELAADFVLERLLAFADAGILSGSRVLDRAQSLGSGQAFCPVAQALHLVVAAQRTLDAGVSAHRADALRGALGMLRRAAR